MGWLLDWLTAFAFTQLVEVGIYAGALERPRRERLAIAAGASAITHPIAWFVIHEAVRVASLGRGIDGSTAALLSLAAAEAFAVGVEAVWLASFGVRRALLWSLVANGASVLLGTFAQRVLGF